MAGYQTTDKTVKQPGNAYGKGKSGLPPLRARTQSYTPELSTNQSPTTGKAPALKKQPTEC